VRRAAVLALGVGLLVAIAMHETGAPSAQAAVKRALARTIDAGSSRFTITWKVADLPHVLPEYKIEGIMDYVRHRGRVVYWGHSELLLDGDLVYMKWPVGSRGKRRWLRYEGDTADPYPFNLQERAMSKPMGLLKFLAGASSDVREVGTQDVRGVPTRHLEGTLDLQTVVDQAPAEEREELQFTLDFISEHQSTMVPFGLWVDSEGVAHRLRIDQGRGASVLIEYYDFGTPVVITPPPPDEIMSADEFFEEIRQQADSDCEHDTSADAGGATSDETVGGDVRLVVCTYPSDDAVDP
jgi:hypothetical protein